MCEFVPQGLGWHPDMPDFRDYGPDSPAVLGTLDQLKKSKSARSRRPMKVDLREYFPPVYDQGKADSATAQACVGLIEYFERRAHGRSVEPSRLFLYQTTRKLLSVTGQAVTNLRSALKAIISFGIPPERLWPYDVSRLDAEPAAHLYSFAGSYRPIHYVRLDARNATGTETLVVVKSFLAAGFPTVFGFPVLTSLSEDSDIAYRPTFDSIRGGHAVVAVGYDDRRLRATRGALLVRNSWGKKWGEDGYGWLPYAYVEERLAVDFWTLLRPDWFKSSGLRRPHLPE